MTLVSSQAVRVCKLAGHLQISVGHPAKRPGCALDALSMPSFLTTVGDKTFHELIWEGSHSSDGSTSHTSIDSRMIEH